MKNLVSADPRKPAAVEAIKAAARLAYPDSNPRKVTLVKINKEGTRVQGNVLGRREDGLKGFASLGTHEADLASEEPAKPAIPVVGEPATLGWLTDRHPATVVEVSKNGKTVTVQEDTWKVTSGNEQNGSAEYEYTRDTDAPRKVFTYRNNGRYVRKGTDKTGTPYLSVGTRRRYYDPSF